MKGVSAFILGAFMLPSVAFGDQAIPYKSVNGWDVLVDKTLGNACFISTSYDTGIVLRMGFDFSGTTRQIYMALGNDNWKSLEEGKDYPIEIRFDNNPVWSATASAKTVGSINFLVVTSTNANFAEEFARKLRMRASFQGREIAHLRLSGSSRALDALLECQKIVDDALKPAAPPQPKDPFSTAPNVKSANDPFEL